MNALIRFLNSLPRFAVWRAVVTCGFVTLISLVACAFSGCAIAPTGIIVETEHVSHPFAGEPFGPEDEEDWLDQLNVGAEWAGEGAYLQMSFGYKLTDGGFYGPPLTFTARAGYRFDLRQVRP